MTVNEKAVYLKGLADGLNYDKNTAEGKLIAALIDLVGDMAKSIEEMDEDLEYLNDYVEELDEDLGTVEEDIYGDDDEDEDEDECDCCEHDDDKDCDCCDGSCCEVECPNCGETVSFDCESDPEEMVCPSCGEKLATLFEESDEDKEDEKK